MNEEAKLSRSDDCNYIGRLEGEPDACVAMTGCPGSHDLEFTIMSEHSSHSTFKWLTSGKVEVVESPFKVSNPTSIKYQYFAKRALLCSMVKAKQLMFL